MQDSEWSHTRMATITSVCINHTHSNNVIFSFAKGEFDSGYKQGNGTKKFADGSVYVGEFRRNHATGRGVMTFNSSDWCGDL